MRPLFLVVLLASLAFVGSACTHVEPTPPARVLSADEVAQLVPAKVKDRTGWGEDVVAAIRLTKKEPTPERVCAVLAVIEQESGFQADPVVGDLPRIVKAGLDDKLDPLGPLAVAAKALIVDEYGARIDKLRTERDLDRLFREVSKTYREKMLPGPIAALSEDKLADFNPVTTAGSMQVKVSYAKELEPRLSDEDVRELMYTRAGGVRFGTARLISYPASYDSVLYRFADYNAGEYTSRNAAFQKMLADLTGEKLITDGDVLAYEKDGDVKDVETNTLKAALAFGATHELSAGSVKKDCKKEKSDSFESTTLYEKVRAAWSAKTAKPAPYAMIPDVALSSPKLSRARTTAWFAQSVMKRYEGCRAKVTP